MTKRTPDELKAAAASVRGARSMGVQTAAAQAAPSLLAQANRWLSATVPGLDQWDDPATLNAVADIEDAAADLAAALELPAFRSRGNEVLEGGYQG